VRAMMCIRQRQAFVTGRDPEQDMKLQCNEAPWHSPIGEPVTVERGAPWHSPIREPVERGAPWHSPLGEPVTVEREAGVFRSPSTYLGSSV
jgi:hypothetical protein